MSTLYVIIGYPGVGKLTVAKALAASIESDGGIVRMVDNHWINNPIFGLVAQDGVTPLPLEVWDRVTEIADAVVKTVETLTPFDWDVIFTSYIEGTSDAGWLPRLEAVAETRGATFVPVHIRCSLEEHERRIVEPARRERMKAIDPALPSEIRRRHEFTPDHENALTLDITSVPPVDAATAIRQHASEVS